ncbi:MAG: hypothetical protein A2Z91_07260 [Deltaproteobacteria bacterium GWA2_38_16]|nr:MAG: hypothetical protein A2Z91_07260 [Deltaproteobacteria bacterium GWA2_38_16]OGQ02708.1 MAG: hypothetical protein A3D19_00595 [Deltaproteobacteria bacterium RIFCSPHIGHO2_02_FULL_38_15]HBQ20565.1 hypothetical protein [Deltaproteobacteria bacterium]
MARFFKAVGALLVTFLIFFGVPVFSYSSFQKIFKMVPPARLNDAAIYQLASLKGLEAFILVILYLLIIDRRRGKEGRYAIFVSLLLFIQAGVIPELWFYITLSTPELYTAAGIVSSFVSYGLSGWFLSKFYKTSASVILP